MKKSQNTEVDKFLAETLLASPDDAEIIESVRNIFLDAHKDVTEDIKYGGIVFSRSDALIGGVFASKKHISIEFSNGADLTDPDGLLEGTGKKRRHLKIITSEDVERKDVRKFVNEISKL